MAGTRADAPLRRYTDWHRSCRLASHHPPTGRTAGQRLRRIGMAATALLIVTVLYGWRTKYSFPVGER